MKKTMLLLLCVAAWLSTMAQYRNPVIPGYHPDPSVCRVGDDFYLVNSSFEYFPGVPIFHSKDLVNWQQVGNVLDRESQLPLKGATSWLGIYAPTIRYHDGTFYMITTNVGNGGNFMVTATNPQGPWSEPVWLSQQGIDPSLYFEGGKCYMVSNPDNTITLCQIDPRTGRQLTESRALWQGTGGRYPEGPHIYKKDGYYYLLISEGGTELAHGLTIARSKSIYGPYEANPANPILTHCSMAGQSNQIQGTGHGDLVQDKDGHWWLVLLAYRNWGGSYHHLGRETFLAPVEWPKGQWPVVNGGNPIDTLMNVPHAAPARPAKRHFHTDFDRSFGPEWVYIQNPDSAKYQFIDGKLRLYGSAASLHENIRPTFVGRRQESPVFCMETKVTLEDSQTGDEGGLAVYQINDGVVEFCLNNFREDIRLKVRYQLKDTRMLKVDKPLGVGHTTMYLRVRSDGRKYYFEYSPNGTRYELADSIDCALLSTEVVGGFTGVVLGMYAYQGSSHFSSGPSFAEFDYLDYREEQ